MPHPLGLSVFIRARPIELLAIVGSLIHENYGREVASPGVARSG